MAEVRSANRVLHAMPGNGHMSAPAAREFALRQQLEFFQKATAALVALHDGREILVPHAALQTPCEVTVTMTPEGALISVGPVPVIAEIGQRTAALIEQEA